MLLGQMQATTRLHRTLILLTRSRRRKRNESRTDLRAGREAIDILVGKEATDVKVDAEGTAEEMILATGETAEWMTAEATVETD